MWVSLSLIVFCKEANIGEGRVLGIGRRYWRGRSKRDRKTIFGGRNARDWKTIVEKRSERDRETILKMKKCEGQYDGMGKG